MPTVRMRLIGSESDTEALIAALHGVAGVELIEQVVDIVPNLDDEPGPPLSLAESGGTAHDIEIDARDHVAAEQVRSLAADLAERFGADLEFIDAF
jgi:hypothetical protein